VEKSATIRMIAAVVCFLHATPAWSYIDRSYTLGQIIMESKNVAVIKVHLVNKERGAIIFKKVADLKGNFPDEMKHQVGDTSKPGAPSGVGKLVLDWAEPEQLAVCFGTTHNGLMTCCGRHWYQAHQTTDPAWWRMPPSDGFWGAMDWAYVGPVTKLRQHVTDIIAGKETIVTAVEYDTYYAGRGRLAQNWSWVAIGNMRRTATTPRIWRVKASLKILHPGEHADKHFVGWGTGAAGEVRGLIERLQSPMKAVQLQAADELGWIGPDAKAAVPALMKVLQAKDAAIRRAGTVALGHIGTGATAAVGPVSKLLHDSDNDVRMAACATLGWMGPAASEAVPALVEIVAKEKQIPLRCAAMEALWRMDSEAHTALPALVQVLESPSPPGDRPHLVGHGELSGGVRVKAAQALGAMGSKGKQAVGPLAMTLTDRDCQGYLRLASADALGAIGLEATAAIPALTKALEDADANFRIHAAEALGKIRPVPRGATVELFEDDVAFLAAHLRLDGRRETKDTFSGGSSIRVGRSVYENISGWGFPIVEKPQLGQYRYVRFAWKKIGKGGIGIQFGNAARFGLGGMGYCAGRGKQHSANLKDVTEVAPADWVVVTRDLYKDFGAFQVQGISLRLIGPGEALFDHIYLGRTVEGLDKISIKK
jgi:HEAT repeat protein